MHTKHAKVRAQQRGIPPFVDHLLDRYGKERYDGHGGVLLFFSKRSMRNMERDLGREPVSRLATWHRAYKVKSSIDGCTVTIGFLTARVWRS